MQWYPATSTLQGHSCCDDILLLGHLEVSDPSNAGLSAQRAPPPSITSLPRSLQWPAIPLLLLLLLARLPCLSPRHSSPITLNHEEPQRHLQQSLRLPTRTMNAQVTTLVLGLALSQGAKRLDLDRPEVLWPLRFSYLAVQLVILGLYLYIAKRVSVQHVNPLGAPGKGARLLSVAVTGR